jgi:hypothetical protein
MMANTLHHVSFTVGDPDTPLTDLAVTAASSNPGIVPNFVVIGTGETRTLRIVPALNAGGIVTITVTVRDTGGRTASDAFKLTILRPPGPC